MYGRNHIVICYDLKVVAFQWIHSMTLLLLVIFRENGKSVHEKGMAQFLPSSENVLFLQYFKVVLKRLKSYEFAFLSVENTTFMFNQPNNFHSFRFRNCNNNLSVI